MFIVFKLMWSSNCQRMALAVHPWFDSIREDGGRPIFPIGSSMESEATMARSRATIPSWSNQIPERRQMVRLIGD
jgi:hypothetical protein